MKLQTVILNHPMSELRIMSASTATGLPTLIERRAVFGGAFALGSLTRAPRGFGIDFVVDADDRWFQIGRGCWF
jgi:hypothetical protein